MDSSTLIAVASIATAGLILLALTAKLLDAVALEKMIEAEHAVHEAAANIPPEICARFETADKLSDEDRSAIMAIATAALAPFQPKPVAKLESDKKTEKKPEATVKPGYKVEPPPAKSTPPVAPAAEQKANAITNTDPVPAPANGAKPAATDTSKVKPAPPPPISPSPQEKT